MTALNEHFDFLRASAERFDAGYEYEAKRIALALRVLLHDTEGSRSVLTQADLKDTLRFLDSDAREDAPPGKQRAYPVGWPVGLVGMRLGNGVSYFPMLDGAPGMPTRYEPFAKWWEERLLVSPDSPERWRRRDFVLGSANKEGGAHLQSEPERWWTVLRDGTWEGAGTAVGPDGEPVPINSLAPAVIRQIGHEVLRTLSEQTEVCAPSPQKLTGSAVVVATVAMETPAPAENALPDPDGL